MKSAKIEAVRPVLMARDVAQSIAFFARLGFDLTFQDSPAVPKYAGVRRGLVELHLQWGDPTQWSYPNDRPAYRFLVNDVDALYAELVAAGDVVPETGGGPWRLPADTPWGTREFHLRDPGDNSLQFYQRR